MVFSEDDFGNGLISAVLFDEKGLGREIGWSGIRRWTPEEGRLWVHLDFRERGAIDWITKNVANKEAAATLLAHETRPRAFASDEHLLVCLRGVNLNPGSDPEDMVSVRMWLGPDMAITTRHRRIMAVNDVRESFAAGNGPSDIGDFLVSIADRLMYRMGPTLEQLEGTVDALESRIIDGEDGPQERGSRARDVRRELGRIRRQTIELRRHLSPQRDTMHVLMMESMPWLSEAHKSRLREVSDLVTRHVEDLDALRDRGMIVQDELRNNLSDTMNNTIYVLTIMSAILLPLGFVTGLLGVNIDGIPAASNSPDAFWLLTGGLAAVAALQYFLFKRLRWL